MGFEDKRQKIQRPSQEFSNIGRGRGFDDLSANPLYAKEPPRRKPEPEIWQKKSRHLPPDVEFDSYSDNHGRRSKIIRLDGRDGPPTKTRKERPPAKKKKPPDSARTRSAPQKSRPTESRPAGGQAPKKTVQKQKPPARKKAKKPKRRLRPEIKRAFLTITSLLAVVITSITVVLFVFKADKITVVGDEMPYTQERIVEASTLHKGDNLLFTSTGSAAAKIKAGLPYVENVVIHRKFPTTFEISVTKMTVQLSLQQGDNWLYINAAGKVAEIAVQPAQNSLQVTGLPLSEVAVGQYISFTDQAYQNAYEDILKALQSENILASCQSMDLSNLYKISLQYENRIHITLGSVTDVGDKLWAALNLIRNEIDDSAKGKLDVSSIKKNGRGIFTKDSVAAATPTPKADSKTEPKPANSDDGANSPNTNANAGDTTGADTTPTQPNGDDTDTQATPDNENSDNSSGTNGGDEANEPT